MGHRETGHRCRRGRYAKRAAACRRHHPDAGRRRLHRSRRRPRRSRGRDDRGGRHPQPRPVRRRRAVCLGLQRQRATRQWHHHLQQRAGLGGPQRRAGRQDGHRAQRRRRPLPGLVQRRHPRRLGRKRLWPTGQQFPDRRHAAGLGGPQRRAGRQDRGRHCQRRKLQPRSVFRRHPGRLGRQLEWPVGKWQHHQLEHAGADRPQRGPRRTHRHRDLHRLFPQRRSVRRWQHRCLGQQR